VQNLQQTATPRFCAQLRQVARYCKEAPQTVVKETKTVAETAAAPAASGATSGAASKLDVSSRMAGLKNMSNPLRFFKKKELSAEEKLLKEYEIPQTAYWLGFAGLIPFLGTTAGVAMFPSDWSSKSLTLQLTYGSSILGFMGAVHWGLAMAQYKASRNVLRYTISVVPAVCFFCCTHKVYVGAFIFKSASLLFTTARLKCVDILVRARLNGASIYTASDTQALGSWRCS